MPNKDAVCLDGFVNSSPLDIAHTDPSYPAHGAGVYNDEILEPIPQRINAPSENVIQRGNSWLILGRDRTSTRASGHGGAAETGAAAIDLCAGMGGPCPNAGTHVDPNFKADGARIYLSQKTDIDDAFKIGKVASPWGKQMPDSVNRSGIGIKADAVRIIGTNGIKLVTRTQNKDSQDDQAEYNGIELIACMDDTDLQYMVKGNNLIEALEGLEKRFNELSGIVLSVIKAQNKFNIALQNHTHAINPLSTVQTAGSPFAQAGMGQLINPVTAVSLAIQPTAGQTISEYANMTLDNFKNRINLNINWNTKYLSSNSSNYILSKYNKVN